jgi:nickel transport protein
MPPSLLPMPLRALTLAALLLAPAAHAHDAWVELQGPPHAVLFGHGPGDTYDADKVKQVAAWGREGQPLPVRRVVTAQGVQVEAEGGPAAMWTLEFDNGFWVRQDGKSRNLPRTAVSGPVQSSSRALKFGKTVLLWSAHVTKPVGQRLEIVPLSVRAPSAGQPLTVQVLYEGRPLPGAKVGVQGPGDGHDGPVVATDAQGRATVTLVKGPQFVTVGHSVPYPGPEAERDNLAANLRLAAP